MLYCQVDDLKTKVTEFKILYLENLKYKKQMKDFTKKKRCEEKWKRNNRLLAKHSFMPIKIYHHTVFYFLLVELFYSIMIKNRGKQL